MKTFIIVSKCSGVIKPNQRESYYFFHFKGVFAGIYLKKLQLNGNSELKIKKGEEYIIFAQFLRCKGSTLEGRIIKFEALEDRFNRS